MENIESRKSDSGDRYFSASDCSSLFQVSIGAVIGKSLRKTRNVLIRHISLRRGTQSSLKPSHQLLSSVQKFQKSSLVKVCAGETGAKSIPEAHRAE